MNEENQDLNQELEPEAPVNEEEQQQEPEAEGSQDEVVAEAKSTGHLSKEEWIAKGGDPAKYKSEKEFVLTGELIELKKAIQKRDEQLENMVKYHQNMIDTQKKNFRAQLEAKLQQARETGDIEGIESLAQEKVRLDQEEQASHQQQEAVNQKQAADWFVARNSHWYNDANQDLKGRAFQVEQELIQSRIYHSYGDLARALEDRMRAEIASDPNKAHLLTIGSTPRPAISQTKSAVNATSAKGNDTVLYSKLSKPEKAMFDQLKRMNSSWTVKEFVEKQQRDGEI